MPTITIPGGPSFEVASDKRLVRAIEENGVDILHRCGGFARCTTCRVDFHEGEPDKMTEAELERLTRANLVGEVRLSCQILCDHDMTLTPFYTLSESNYDDPGPTPEEHITPDPVWIDVPFGASAT
jgi:ferredoxin